VSRLIDAVRRALFGLLMSVTVALLERRLRAALKKRR